MLDPKRRHRPVYYHLSKSNFCGTDSGTVSLKKSILLCVKWQVSYKYLTVFVQNEGGVDQSPCILLRSDWSKEDQTNWQTVIGRHLGFRRKWSVTKASRHAERVLLCLTENSLALNKSSFSGTSGPHCLQHLSFKDFDIFSDYDKKTKKLQITSRKKGHCLNEDVHYEVTTSLGQEIITALRGPNHTLTRPPLVPSLSLLMPDESGPPPCSFVPLFVHTPTPGSTPIMGKSSPFPPGNLQEPLSLLNMPPPPKPPKPHVKPRHRKFCPPENPLCNMKSFRRSYSMGEKDLLSRKKSRKALIRNKVSISGGYDSDSESIENLPAAVSETIRNADRETLYMHKQWYKSFKSQMRTSVYAEPAQSERDSTEPKLSIPAKATDKRESYCRSIFVSSDEDDYWIGEVSFTLQNRLEKKHPDPDTMKLGWRQIVRLNFHLYPPLGGGISGGWQDLADYIGLTGQEIAMVDHFCLVHQQTPVSVLLDHWQFVYNKQTRQQVRNPAFVPEFTCPPCTKQQLAQFLQDIGRLDILEICNLP
ncbi:uncharacterized protein LOC135470574 isoform X2 [Liolophura sinensis]